MIKIARLSKVYGKVWALRVVNLTVESGDMFGLIGPNGAGKTTLIKILATLLKPSEGTAEVDGKSVQRYGPVVRRLIGYMPDQFGVYEEMRVTEYLDFFASSYGLMGPKRRATVDSVLELTDLAGKRETIIGTLSRGMQQRLGLARVLVHDPKVLLLDEPAANLDPRARIEIKMLLKELQKMGKTILISSHILADLQDLCNKVALIEKGRVLFSGAVQEAREKVMAGDLYYVEVLERQEEAGDLLKSQAFVLGVEARDGHLEVRMRLEERDRAAEIAEVLVKSGYRLRSFKPADVSLEDAFMKMTRGEVS
jgi:ABC-2 type transport system ATP-binding protein